MIHVIMNHYCIKGQTKEVFLPSMNFIFGQNKYRIDMKNSVNYDNYYYLSLMFWL